MTTPTPPLRDSTRAAVAAACRQHHIRPDGIDHALDLLGDLRRYELPGAQLDHAGLDADLAIVARTPDLAEPVEHQAARYEQAQQQMQRSTGMRMLAPATQPLAPLPALPSTAPALSPLEDRLAQRLAQQMAADLARGGGGNPITAPPTPPPAA